MKKNLQEELERIHGITYGNKVISEGFIDSILQKVGIKTGDEDKKSDDPKKADLVSTDVAEFFKTLEDAAKSGGLSQQSYGGMSYQKSVESMQIGLMLLGYELPKHGVDGLFGPETAQAVQKFTSEKLGGGEKKEVNEVALSSPIGATSVNSPFGGRWGRMHYGVDLKASSGTSVKSPLDGQVIDAAMRSDACGGTIYVQHADGYRTRYCHCKQINVSKGQTVSKGDILGLSGGGSGDPGRGRSDGAHLHFEVYKNGKPVNPMEHLGSEVGEFVAGSVSGGSAKATTEMLEKLLELLKERGVKSEELKVFIDSVLTGGSAEFTDLDLNTNEGFQAYAEICQKFISANGPNPLGITGEMMAKGAKEAFMRYQRYVPPELALSQLVLEGGIRNGKLDSRPIRTKNPFNVGNTDSGANVEHSEVQSGINTYYNLVAKNYLGKGRTAKDLITNFVNKSGNRYASAPDYEKHLNTLASQAHRIAAPVMAKLTPQKAAGSETTV